MHASAQAGNQDTCTLLLLYIFYVKHSVLNYTCIAFGISELSFQCRDSTFQKAFAGKD